MWSLKAWRRRRHLSRTRIPSETWATVESRLPVLEGLADDDRDRLRGLALTFLHEKAIECAGGMSVTDTMRMRLGLMAALPILNLGMDWYEGWHAVVLYPGPFIPNRPEVDGAGVVRRSSHALSGEAWSQGPVILSWEDVDLAGQRTGHNVVVHELAHKLDLLNGAANGFPPLHPEMRPSLWSRIFADAYSDFRRRARDASMPPIDPYGTRSPAEFFAVLSEVFFETPTILASVYPEVHAQLEAFYRQSPLSREESTECPATRLSDNRH